ncbi:MAG: undecaprenyldiphospho-muramoylpentapeptide beta-N-acetylglucosaminyltransferase [Acidobacteria bacterium]|nr:undecaprenyldiphospho-muramoylpentapeptide beta-N-acetylglucosaminyltransferase [Acidobacteriota bacterium]
MRRVLIAGGGTGGHIFPAIAIARSLTARAPGCEVVMVGTARGLETKLVPEAGFRLITIPVAGLRGKSVGATARGLAMLPRALGAALRITGAERPEVVVGVGGYASGPILAAAILRRIPTLIQDQNLAPGMTNRWLAPFASEVAIAFDGARRFLRGRGIVTGNPIRPEFAHVPPRPKGRATRHLLVYGGSQGSSAVNAAMADAAPKLGRLRGALRVLHQTGAAGVDAMRAAYERAGIEADVRPFVDDMAGAMAGADLILARSGGGVAEITAAGRGSILVPLPTAAHDHQTHNARALEEAGASVVIAQRDLTGERLATTLSLLLGDEARLDAMAAAARALGRPDAADRIAALIEGLASSRATAAEAKA